MGSRQNHFHRHRNVDINLFIEPRREQLTSVSLPAMWKRRRGRPPRRPARNRTDGWSAAASGGIVIPVHKKAMELIQIHNKAMELILIHNGWREQGENNCRSQNIGRAPQRNIRSMSSTIKTKAKQGIIQM